MSKATFVSFPENIRETTVAGPSPRDHRRGVMPPGSGPATSWRTGMAMADVPTTPLHQSQGRRASTRQGSPEVSGLPSPVGHLESSEGEGLRLGTSTPQARVGSSLSDPSGAVRVETLALALFGAGGLFILYHLASWAMRVADQVNGAVSP